MFVRSGTRLTRFSHSLIVEASSRSNMTAALFAVFNFALYCITDYSKALAAFLQLEMHRSCSRQDNVRVSATRSRLNIPWKGCGASCSWHEQEARPQNNTRHSLSNLWCCS